MGLILAALELVTDNKYKKVRVIKIEANLKKVLFNALDKAFLSADKEFYDKEDALEASKNQYLPGLNQHIISTCTKNRMGKKIITSLAEKLNADLSSILTKALFYGNYTELEKRPAIERARDFYFQFI